MNLSWPPERIDQLRKMREIGMSYTQIASALGTSVGSAKVAYTRYVNGRKPDIDEERERSAGRREQISAWEKANRELVNAGKRRRRAEKAAKKE